jgi:dipeptidyl aminopeptidase
MVDGRGTGFKGRDFRVCVHGKLGTLETRDQVNAGKYWAQLSYVDAERMAIWGWSYGGYMTSKVIEANNGVFKVGMAVAPVTDWRFYDSIYTERYMLTPKMNEEGYNTSAVRDMAGFGNASYLLVHGTGDDNVHFQNAAALVDALTQASVHTYRTQFFTDNTHSINSHGANKELYFLLSEFLWEGFGGEKYDSWRKKVYHKHHDDKEKRSAGSSQGG